MNELNSLYDLIGGETNLRALVDRFYDIMDTSPEAKDIRAYHAKSLNGSREKLFMFLSAGQADLRYTLRNMGIHVYVSVTCLFRLGKMSVTSGYGA